MNKIQKIAIASGAAISTVMAFAPMAFAQTAFGTSTAATTITSLVGDVALIIGTVLGVILGLVAALMGLGWGIRKFRQYVSGKKF